MSEETTRGFIARLQAKSAADAKLSYAECKYAEAVERVAKKK